jgi:hypothetical protein
MIIQNKKQIQRIKLLTIKKFISTYQNKTFKKNQSKLRNYLH